MRLAWASELETARQESDEAREELQALQTQLEDVTAKLERSRLMERHAKEVAKEHKHKLRILREFGGDDFMHDTFGQEADAPVTSPKNVLNGRPASNASPAKDGKDIMGRRCPQSFQGSPF